MTSSDFIPPQRRPRSPRRRAAIRRHRRRILRRPLPPVAVVPTLFTLGNLLAGFAAIHYAARPIGDSGMFGLSTLTLAGALIFLGMLLDGIDGSVARLTRSTTELGAQLDSLADVVTFGVAPALMMLRLVSYYLISGDTTIILGPDADPAYARIIWGVAAAYVCCTALRLARFNVETPSAAAEDHQYFRGLPSPGAAGAVASLIVLHQHWLAVRYVGVPPAAFERWTALVIPFITLLCGLAMVSTVKYVHLPNRYLRGGRDFGYVVRLVLPAVLAIWFLQEVLALLFTVYALSGPLRKILRQFRQRSAIRPPAVKAEKMSAGAVYDDKGG